MVEDGCDSVSGVLFIPPLLELVGLQVCKDPKVPRWCPMRWTFDGNGQVVGSVRRHRSLDG